MQLQRHAPQVSVSCVDSPRWPRRRDAFADRTPVFGDGTRQLAVASPGPPSCPVAHTGPTPGPHFRSVSFASLVLRFSWLTLSWMDSLGS